MKRSHPNGDDGSKNPAAKIKAERHQPVGGRAAKESKVKTEEPTSSLCASSDVPAAGVNDSTNAARKPESGPDYSNVTYPNPKNFAERLLGVLESGVASELLWWVGNGKAVALHPKRIKKSNLLEPYFRCKSYSALIRNFNRWGFRRVNFFAVSLSDGVVTYQNSLFRRAEPHLVKHMRMDSDVQDVFERHQLPALESQQSTPPSAASESALAHEAKNIRSNLLSADNSDTYGYQETAQSNSQGSPLLQQQQQQESPPGSFRPLQHDATVSLDQLVRLAQQYLSQPAPVEPPWSCSNSIRAALQLLIDLSQQQRQQQLQQILNARQFGNDTLQQQLQAFSPAAAQGQINVSHLRQINSLRPNLDLQGFIRQLGSQSHQTTSALQPMNPPLQPQQQQMQPAQQSAPQQGAQQRPQQAPDVQAMMRLLLERQRGGAPNSGS